MITAVVADNNSKISVDTLNRPGQRCLNWAHMMMVAIDLAKFKFIFKKYI